MRFQKYLYIHTSAKQSRCANWATETEMETG